MRNHPLATGNNGPRRAKSTRNRVRAVTPPKAIRVKAVMQIHVKAVKQTRAKRLIAHGKTSQEIPMKHD